MLKMIQEEPGIPQKYESYLYSTIANYLLKKFHWEVKIEMIHFCELEIQKQLHDQGMLDGTFPNVTFSKETKKIVTLTKNEINLRITRVLNEISRRGYLGVILSCLKDETDFEVRKETIHLIQRLMKILNNYDYATYLNELPKTISDISQNPSFSEETLCDEERFQCDKAHENSSMSQELNYDSIASDKTIESILNIGDINLVNNIYASNLLAQNLNNLDNNSGNNQQSNCDEFDRFLYQKYTNIGPKEFIDEVNKVNFTQLLLNNEQQTESIDNFKSLLEDIKTLLQREYDSDILNDCY